ncbi:MAG TPA: VOC family protein [Candidatus Acidoferrales bacterium]|nr:VOC family protein [Candidatus Acidoferrales bacterium]
MLFERRQLLRIFSFAFGSGFIFDRNQLALATQTGAQPKTPPPAAASAAANGVATGADMEKVIGIGGLFFRAHDPKVLGRWYEEHLGITIEPTSQGQAVWQQEAGPTVFTPFPETTKYFGDPSKVWMVNFRVRDLDKMVAQLRAAGIEAKDPENYPGVGRFSRIHDPEGNPIELWQPEKPAASG